MNYECMKRQKNTIHKLYNARFPHCSKAYRNTIHDSVQSIRWANNYPAITYFFWEITPVSSAFSGEQTFHQSLLHFNSHISFFFPVLATASLTQKHSPVSKKSLFFILNYYYLNLTSSVKLNLESKINPQYKNQLFCRTVRQAAVGSAWGTGLFSLQKI